MIVLDPALPGLRLAHHRDRQQDEHRHQDHQGHGKAPVQQEGERQQGDNRDVGGKLVLEEGEPQPEQRVRPAKHDLHQAPGVDVAVEGQRQRQDVAKVAVHDLQAVAVRHALGMQGGRDVGGDGCRADREPDAQQYGGLRPKLVRRQLVGARQQPYNPAEQHRVQELQPGHNDVCDAQHDRQALVGPQDRESLPIDFHETHDAIRCKQG